MFKKKQFKIFFLFLLIPFFSFSASFSELVDTIFVGSLIKGFVGLIFSLSFLFFLWKALQVILNFASSKRGEYLKGLFFSIFLLFVMFSIWSLVNIVLSTNLKTGTGSSEDVIFDKIKF